MKNHRETSVGDAFPLETVVSVLAAHPVRLAVLFGSQAAGDHHEESDVDVAVELADLRPGDAGYNDAFFGLGADLSDAIDSDDLDVVDVHACPPSLARAIFETGVLLLGDPERAHELERELTRGGPDDTPRERIDSSLARIDELIG